ncbi:hypothetical protein QCA50_004738 [Cerrena zonata]|uniref:Uncharacterized protein n=1 Tax=Cerrena zonata TaxID=2478898 RepID=A0AAW0GCT4_9APHY
MTKGKLKLKRTPAEQAAHDARKARRAARKASKRPRYHDLSDGEGTSSSHAHKRAKDSPLDDPYDDHVQDDEAYGPPPPPSSSSRSHKPDYDDIQARLEEERFREKLWGAFGDDEHLDSVEARLNDYAHVPRRWRSGGMDRMEDDLTIDPHYMEDEDYAEWVRVGMWKRKHADEYAEQARQEGARAARLEREKAARQETKKLEAIAEEERRRRRRERHDKRWKVAKEHYEEQWKVLLGAQSVEDERKDLRFEDVPWPVFPVDIGPSTDKKGKLPSTESSIHLEDITVDAVSQFLLSTSQSNEDRATPTDDIAKKLRRDKLREAMLRFHPDKFEGRILSHVREDDRDKVREGVSKVAVALNRLMESK